MRKNLVIILVITLAIVINSCKKNVITGEPADDGMMAILISGTWQLKSASYFNNNGNITSKYQDSTPDSVLFLFGQDRNFGELILTNISSFIGGSNRLMKYSIPIQPAENFQKRISTVLLSPGWKDGYSDSMHVTFFANTTLVFMVKDSVGTGYEIDTLKKVRGY